MDGLLSKAFDSHEYQSLNDRSASFLERLRAFGHVFSHRIRRGGLGLLLRVSGLVFGLVLLIHLAPTHLADYRNVLRWSSKEPAKAIDLRIVVFGSQDLVGSSIDTSSNRVTWPERLCKELACSSLLSFVPTSDFQSGLTSNGIYEDELQALQLRAQQTNIAENPAADYFFMTEEYAVPAHTPDLEQQVQQFLSLAPSDVPPHETLWIFTFGTWDIWKLSAMPIASGERVVDALAAHVFSQIEILYAESLNEKSIAFSDFWKNASQTDVDELADPEAPAKVDQRKLESFRIIIPDLFDISLTPGWQARPAPPSPHSGAEQIRNSAMLTQRWNTQLRSQMDSWSDRGSTKPEGAEGVEPEEVKTKPIEVPNAETEGTIYAPLPRRLGFSSDPASKILDAMTEEEMQRANAKDSKGRGTLPLGEPMRFRDVWTPCVSVSTEEAEDGTEQTIKCDSPDNHLFHDAFTLGQRAISELAKQTAQGVQEHLLPGLQKMPL